MKRKLILATIFAVILMVINKSPVFADDNTYTVKYITYGSGVSIDAKTCGWNDAIKPYSRGLKWPPRFFPGEENQPNEYERKKKNRKNQEFMLAVLGNLLYNRSVKIPLGEENRLEMSLSCGKRV